MAGSEKIGREGNAFVSRRGAASAVEPDARAFGIYVRRLVGRACVSDDEARGRRRAARLVHCFVSRGDGFAGRGDSLLRLVEAEMPSSAAEMRNKSRYASADLRSLEPI